VAVLIDTSALIAVERGTVRLDQLAPGEDRSLSVITVSELLQGFHRLRGARKMRSLAFLEYLLDRVAPVEITEVVARVHADLWSSLARRGEMIAAHDLWIAATALTRGLGVVTTDVRDFSRVPGLRVVAA
jgi:tRNA(fMet)-specific endonuclease VapC